MNKYILLVLVGMCAVAAARSLNEKSLIQELEDFVAREGTKQTDAKKDNTEKNKKEDKKKDDKEKEEKDEKEEEEIDRDIRKVGEAVVELIRNEIAIALEEREGNKGEKDKKGDKKEGEKEGGKKGGKTEKKESKRSMQ